MSDEARTSDDASAETDPSLEPVDDDMFPVMPPSGLDEEEFEVPSGRYLGLFGVVGALVGLAIGIQQGNAALGMAIGLVLGVAIGLVLNAYTAR